MSEEQAKYDGGPKHTPGPWTYTFEMTESDPTMPYCLISAGKGYWGGGNGNGFEFSGIANEADARLIAAAPELLEVIEEFVSGYEIYLETKVPLDAEQSKALHMKMRAAIAKAKGEAQ